MGKRSIEAWETSEEKKTKRKEPPIDCTITLPDNSTVSVPKCTSFDKLRAEAAVRMKTLSCFVVLRPLNGHKVLDRFDADCARCRASIQDKRGLNAQGPRALDVISLHAQLGDIDGLQMQMLRDMCKRECGGNNIDMSIIFGKQLQVVIERKAPSLIAIGALVSVRADVNARGSSGFTPLIAAIISGHRRICTFLIDHKARIDVMCKLSRSPLLYAVEHQRRTICNHLLLAKAKVCNVYPSPLALACRLKDNDITLNLLDADAEVNIDPTRIRQGPGYGETEGCTTPLKAAVQACNLLIVQTLLSKRANVNDRASTQEGRYGAAGQYRESRDCPVLLTACLTDNVEIVRTLINAAANPSVSSGAHCGRTALMEMCMRGKETMVDLLLETRVDVNTQTWSGSALHHVCSYRGSGEFHGRYGNAVKESTRVSLLKKLLEAQANVDQRGTEDGNTPLTLAASTGLPLVCSALIESKAKVDETGRENMTPLCFAVSTSVTVAQILIDAKADVNARCRHKNTPLMYAAGADRFEHSRVYSLLSVQEMIRLLLRHKANVNDTDSVGKTALMTACSYRQYDAAICLLKEGNADAKLAAANGKTAIQMCTHHRYGASAPRELVDLLLARGAVMPAPGSPSSHGYSEFSDSEFYDGDDYFNQIFGDYMDF